MKVHEIETPVQLTEHLENLRIVEPVHFHRELRNRREQFIWCCEKRFPFPAFDVHLDDHRPAGIAVLVNLVFQRVEETRISIAGTIANAFVVKNKSAAIADWPRRIKTIVLVHGNVISARHLAAPIVIWANTVRISCIERLNQILAHQITAIISAAKALERAILQNYWLKLRKDGLAQPALRRATPDVANHDCCSCCMSNYDKRGAD